MAATKGIAGVITIGGVRFWSVCGACWIARTTSMPAVTLPNAAKP